MGIFVGGTGNANKIDDYEEGTFSPAWFDDGGVFVSSYGRQYGQYTKIGNICHFVFGLRINAYSRTPNSGQICRVGNLPFTPRTTNDDEEVPFTMYARLWGNGDAPAHAGLRQDNSGTQSPHVEFFMFEEQTGNDDLLLGGDFPTNNQARCIVAGFYHVA